MGMLAQAMKKNAVVLQKPSGTIAIRVDLDTVQRKFYNALLFVAKHDLKKDKDKKRFSVSLVELKQLLNKYEKIDRNNSYYIAKLKEIKRKDAEYNILDKDSDWEIQGWVSLVSDLQIKKERRAEQVTITFELPERIKWALIDPEGIYANINLVVIRGLRSKYAIILYELVKDYEKVEIPEMDMQDFRKLFNIENKHKRIDNLKSRVLDPAIKELNENENINFLISYELRKTGKVYTHIKFHVRPKPAKLKLEQQAKKLLSEEVRGDDDAKELLALMPPEYREKAKVVSLILGSLKTKGKDYTRAQIQYVLEKQKESKVKDFVVFLKKAFEEDYASFEEIDLDDFVTVEDAIGYRAYLKDRYVEIKHIAKEDDGYLVRLDDVNTGELVKWIKISEEKLLKIASKNKELKRKKEI